MESNTTDQFPVNDCLTDILINIRDGAVYKMDGWMLCTRSTDLDSIESKYCIWIFV